MLSLRKQSFQPGWVAIAPLGDSVRLAHVVCRKGQLPKLRWVCQAAWSDPTQALRTLRRARALNSRRTVAVLQRADYQLLAMDAPELPREEWRDAVRWKLKDMVDFPVDTASVQVLEVPSGPAQRRGASLLAVAAPHAGLMPLAEAAADAGVPWQAIDIPETALRNLSALAEEPGRGQALLHVGALHSSLVVTWQGELLLSRHIDVGLPQLTHADEDTRQLAYERASLELQRTLDSAERQFSDVSLAGVMVAPGAVLADFIAYARDLVYAPVTAYEPQRWIDFSAVPELADGAEQSAYLPAIGAALRSD